jgi:ATP-dependent Clp protease ATP-binding subunit ClpC
MTTNLGARDISRGAMGFSLEGSSENDYQLMKAKVNEELKRSFRPEFLNRVDETIVFPQLSQIELLQIVELFIKRLATRLEERDLTLELTTKAKERLMEIGYEPALGARPLRRAVQREIEDRISEQILQGELKNSSHIVVDFVNGEFTFVSKLREPVAQAV